MIGSAHRCSDHFAGVLKTCLNPPRGRGEKGIGTSASEDGPAVTSQPIWLSTNFMTLEPDFDPPNWWEVSMEHLQRVWYASGHLLPFPHFDSCLCSNCWDQIPRTCHVVTWRFNSKTPWYFLDFVFFCHYPCTNAGGQFVAEGTCLAIIVYEWREKETWKWLRRRLLWIALTLPYLRTRAR